MSTMIEVLVKIITTGILPYAFETSTRFWGYVLGHCRALAVIAIICSVVFFLIKRFAGRLVTNQVPGVRPWYFVTSRDRVWISAVMKAGKSRLGVLLGFRSTVMTKSWEEKFRHFWRKNWFYEKPAPLQGRVMHKHPGLAAERRGVHMLIFDLLKRAQLVPYDVSTSQRTLKANAIGYHGHFSARDYNFLERNDVMPDNGVFVLIDVDYYINIHELASLMKPMVLYTFNPIKNTGSTAESTWYVENGQYVYNVDGGAVYKHPVWEYGNRDYVNFAYGGATFLYAVERLRPEPGSTHEVILLQPTAYCADIKDVYVVERRNFGTGVFRDGNSVVIQDGPHHFKLHADLYSVVVSKMKLKNFSHFTLTQYLTENKKDIIEGNISYLGQWFVDKNGEPNVDLGLTYASVMTRNDGTFISNEIKPVHVMMAMPPTNLSAKSATKDVVSDAAAVTQRISAVHNGTVPALKYSRYADEFIDLISADVGVGRGALQPFDVEALVKSVERRETRNKILGAAADPFTVGLSNKVVVESFVKKELYAAAGDERNISPTDDNHLYKLSLYAYAIKEMFKATKWYMPGLTPKQIARRVVELHSSGQRVWETDFSRFDGRTSKWLRSLEIRLAKFFFTDSTAAHLIENEIERAEARTRAGSYETGGSRLSGSPLTTIMNTYINAFVQYSAYREDGAEPKLAYSQISMCYGDDGLMAGNTVDKHMEQVCKDVGLAKLKMVACGVPDRPFAGFVGRIFPCPGGSEFSFQDPNRVWSKIHITSRGNAVDMRENFAAKLASFAVTDGNTPVLGKYVRKMLRLIPEGAKYVKNIENKEFLLANLTDQWLFKESKARISESWPQEESSGFEDVYAGLLGLGRNDLDIAEARIDAATRLDDLANIMHLPPVKTDPRFIYGADPFSFGMPIGYDNNKKNKFRKKGPTGSGPSIPCNLSEKSGCSSFVTASTELPVTSIHAKNRSTEGPQKGGAPAKIWRRRANAPSAV